MNVLVVFTHPSPTSFVAHLRDVAVETLSRRGHAVDLLDLGEEQFDPLLSAPEWRAHRQGLAGRPAIADHAARLAWAQGLLLVYPTWWGGQPALLKGWLDRVLTDGVAYTLPPGADRIRPGLRHIRRLGAVTTHGSPHWMNRLQGEPGRLVISRTLRPLTHPLTRVSWLACYGLDRDDPARRDRFEAKVRARLGRW